MSFLQKIFTEIFTVTANKKWKIFGVQTDIEWYDIKTKFKQLIRKITYSHLFQEMVCIIVVSYMKFVYFSSKKIFVNREIFENEVGRQKPVFMSTWHNRLMMVPFVAHEIKKIYPHHKFAALASKHGDGKIVSRVIEKLKVMPILGSSQDGRKSSRGIDIGSFKKIFTSLRSGYSLGITPDGPRGPAQKINGELINIARISGVGIMPISYAASRCKIFDSWDKFRIPLPFGTLAFVCGEIIYVAKNADEEEVKKLTDLVEKRMDEVQDKADAVVAIRS